MSLLAASSGATVYSYEPNPLVFKGLTKNALLNKSIGSPIQLFNQAVSSKSGFLDLNVSEPSRILSPIVFTNWQSKSKVEIVGLTEIVKSLQSELLKNLKIVIKMDIEGAEWESLRDSATLRILKTTQSTLILALHPGLQRPPKSISSTIGRLRFYWWNIRNILDSWFLFKRVPPYCLIYRTNLNQVRRPSMFCLLVLAGNHEFVFSFGEKN